ncbi:MAG: DHH family phosphoesterase [Clostridia bacterium]|nr:DHH family phosphoesterase [Clostridia bacterium]
MRKKQVKTHNLLLRLVTAFIFALVAACIAMLIAKQTALFFAFSLVTIGLFIWAFVLIRRSGNVVSSFYRSVIGKLTVPNSDIYNHFSLPVVILQNDEVIWYNGLFRSAVLKGDDAVGALPESVLSMAARSVLEATGKCDVSAGGKHYMVYGSSFTDETTYSVLYYVDITQLKNTQREYEETRPVVAVLAIDSFEEITDDMAESDQAKFKGAIDKEIERFTGEISGITKKLKNNRYISVFDERSLSLLKVSKLSILDHVRNLDFGNKTRATLSIGIGHGENSLKQCEVLALQALEMSQGRGGDQATIKTGDSYEFYGGVTNESVEKRTKVKTRVVASALKELIRSSDRVFIMGHKYGDVDSLGASYGLWKCVCDLGKEGYMIVDEKTHLADSMIQKIRNEAPGDPILNGEDAEQLLTRQSLLIVCDTHRKDFAEYPALIDLCRTTVVIDHHRKNIDFIDNSVIFYHEPHASSACEMVAELVQYIHRSAIQKSQAEALLAGIMLDTRNFVLRTGVRTFEASAYLRGCGADPVAVKKLFSDSIAIYRERASLVSHAEFFDRFAIAIGEENHTVSRVAASQAADELLNIENVDASFVVFSAGETINISARSLGKFNVQLVMEALGGGGHHTMAATQIQNVTLDEAKTRLIHILEQTTRKDELK